MSSEVCLDMEIRKLRPGELYILSNILSISDSWKKLMAIVPKQGNVPKFSSDHISIIEQTTYRDKRNAAEVFLDEWSTMGRKRPTLRLLLELLTKAELFRAADYVACDILKQERPKRPDYGPAASIDISDAAINKLLGENQMLPEDISTNSVIIESTAELISEINRIYSGDDANKAVNENILDDDNANADNSLNYQKTAGIDLLASVKSDLIKFSVTDICKEHTEHTSLASTSKSNPAEIKKESSIKPLDATAQYYECEEVSSQELPVFLNQS
ncbi:protein Tube [Cataglyphis hispanica]|uniref:protein Tube n=1 Tax=Cataglyphis hispanica TaxID=1086592 RepID=UPI0021805517|nr:protein Tube [Cataglyphis hispanica]